MSNNTNFKGQQKTRYGFIAQDIPESLKDLVGEQNGTLSVNYLELVTLIPSLCKDITELEEKHLKKST